MALETPFNPKTERPKKIFDTNKLEYGDSLVDGAMLSAETLCGGAFERLEKTALPAIKLHIFIEKLLHPHLSDKEVAAKTKILAEDLSKKEKRFRNPKNPLPTIGIEVELPVKSFSPDLNYPLMAISIPNYRENNDLREINPNFSYSPWVQARILQDITTLGIVPLDIKDNTVKINTKTPLSLHINFGVPNIIDWERFKYGFDPQLTLITDIFTYAYSSPKRIRERKSNVSFTSNGSALKSKKDRSRVNSVYRIELRTTEFKDYPTYRLLIESQRIMAMFFASVKFFLEIKSVSDVDRKLSNLWRIFNLEATKYIREEEELQPNLVDSQKYTTATTMEALPRLKVNCRSLINKYSRKVAAVLKKEKI